MAQLRTQIRRRLRGPRQELLDKIATTALTDSATTVTLTYGQGVARGTLLEIGDEELYVWSYDSATKIATVGRGWNSTTAAAATVGTVVTIAPRFSRTEIDELIRDELQSWPRDLGQLSTVDLAATEDDTTVVLTWAGRPITGLLAAWLQPDDDLTHPWIPFDVNLITDADGTYRVQLQRKMDQARTITLVVRSEFDLTAITTGSTVLEDDVGLTVGMLDCLRLGVSWRSLVYREVDRTTPVAASATALEQNPPTHLLQTAAAMKQARDARLAEEVARIHAQFPILHSDL